MQYKADLFRLNRTEDDVVDVITSVALMDGRQLGRAFPDEPSLASLGLYELESDDGLQGKLYHYYLWAGYRPFHLIHANERSVLMEDHGLVWVRRTTMRCAELSLIIARSQNGV